MSLIAVQGGATGTGTVTLLAPITNTNRTLTLPDVTDTVAGIAATQTLTNKTLTTPVINSLSSATATALTLQSAGTTAITVDTSQNATFVGNVNTATGKKYQVNSKTVNALAWVNLNASGVVQQSFNISSVTVNATGDYTLNFTTALSDAGYVVCGTSSDTPTYGRLISVSESTAPTTSAVRVVSFTRAAGALAAGNYMSFVIFGN